MPHANRLFVLGAGFSCAAGLPLAVPLWKEIRGTAARYPKDQRADKFNTDLNNYIAFRKDALGEQLTPEKVNFEDFIRYLDIKHYLGLRGSDTWSTEGNEGTIVTKYLIGKILACHLNDLQEIPDLCLDFAKRLDLHDTVITFNYDRLPDQDDYLRQILYTLIANYQRYNVERDHLGRLKSPLTIVDYFGDANAEKRFRERYRFVDWSMTKLFGNGFHADSLDSMFAFDFAELPARS